MLCFEVYEGGKLAQNVNLSGAYVVGTDDVPLRAEISFKNGVIACKKRAAGPAGLALLWEVNGAGSILLESIRVQERERPYLLQVELARGRLLRINHKLEDWSLLELAEFGEVMKQVEQARELLIDALKADQPAKAAELADKSLSMAILASEELSRVQARTARQKRLSGEGGPRGLFSPGGAAPRRTTGCGVHLDPPSEATRKRLFSCCDHVTVPIIWRDIEPTEQAFNWKPLDTWVELLTRNRMPVRASALLSFHEHNVPDWLYIWETDFDTIRDLAFEHARRLINRYGQYIQTWTVASGIHGNNCFVFSFDQLMELTRTAAALMKQMLPRGTAILEITAPWGEYYARNQRTIPALLYADMAIQSGVNFDAFGLRWDFGAPRDGGLVRDMFQISAMLDQFAKLGKPLHITGVQVPSGSTPARPQAAGTAPPKAEVLSDAGTWHEPWSEPIQAEWLRRFTEIAFSKPFVESVTWQTFADRPEQELPFSGLLRSDLAPKDAYRELLAARKELGAGDGGAKGPGASQQRGTRA